MKASLTATFLLALASCSARSERGPAPIASALPPGIAAIVGPHAISIDAITRIAEVQKVPARTALEQEVRTTLFAAGARNAGFGETAQVRAAVRGRLARALLERLRNEAQKTDVDDAEVAQATERHFAELDRPEAFRVVHALVQLPENADLAAKAQAKAIAERIAEQVAPAADADDFRKRAEATPDRAGFELLVETLRPVAADGRVVDVEAPTRQSEIGERYAVPFARAAARLQQPGQKSGIVATEFGFHVLMLLDRTPPKVVPFEERKRMLTEEILTERAKRLKQSLLENLASTSAPTIERSADSLLATAVTALTAAEQQRSQNEAP